MCKKYIQLIIYFKPEVLSPLWLFYLIQFNSSTIGAKLWIGIAAANPSTKGSFKIKVCGAHSLQCKSESCT